MQAGSTGPVPVDNPWDAFADDQLGVMDHLGIRHFFEGAWRAPQTLSATISIASTAGTDRRRVGQRFSCGNSRLCR